MIAVSQDSLHEVGKMTQGKRDSMETVVPQLSDQDLDYWLVAHGQQRLRNNSSVRGKTRALSSGKYDSSHDFTRF